MQKSKILALLLAVAMIAAMIVVPANATTAPTTCAHCGAVAEWIPLEGTIDSVSFTSSGHYYLSGDAQPKAGNFLQIYGAGVKVCLDLNGHTLQAAEGVRAIQAYTKAEFAIMDSSAAKTGRVIGNGEAAGGEAGLVRISSAGTKVYVYGGTFTNGVVSSEDGKGGGFFVNRGTELHIMGGLITGNSAANGGNIYVANYGALYVSGDAIISDGVANASSGAGGNIAAIGDIKSEVYENPTVEIFGNAQVIGGSANVAGNIEIKGAELACGESVVDYHANLKIYGNAKVLGGTIAKPGKSNPSCIRVNNYTVSNVSGNAVIDSMVLTASTLNTIEGGTINTLNVRMSDRSAIDIYGGNIGVLCGNDHREVTVHNGLIGEVYGGTKPVGDYAGYVENIAAPAATGADALVMNIGESGMAVYHKAGECEDCGVTYDGTLDLMGYTVTVPTGKTLDASVGGNIIDSVGGGKLVGAALFNDENAMLPITTADGIVLEEVPVVDAASAYQAGDATAKYAFYIDNAAADTKLDEALAAGTATFDVYVKWNNGTADVEDIFVLDATTAAQYAQAATWDSSMIVLNLAGLTNVTLLECAVRVTSNGVTLQ